MSELKINLDPATELSLVRNLINMAETFNGFIGDIATIVTDACQALDPFLKARDIYLDKLIQSSDKDVVKIMLVFEEKDLLGKWAKYINKEVMEKVLLNPSISKEIEIILVNKADATSVKFNQIDVGIRVQYSTEIPDDDFYAIGIDTEETLRHTNEEYLGVPFVNIYYHPEALAKAK